MRKAILILVAAMIVFPSTHAQQFKLTINGFVNAEDENKNYIVYEYNELGKEDLFKNVMIFATQTYKSAKDVVSKVDNEVITITAFQPKRIYAKTLKYDLAYTIVINFKDNKIKIDAPSFECTTFAFDKPYRLTMTGSNGGLGREVTNGIFKKDGKPSLKDTISELESFFNIFSELINKAAQNKSNNEDW